MDDMQSDLPRADGAIAARLDRSPFSPGASLTSTSLRTGSARPALPAKHRKICLFGMFGGGNFGNDGSLESMLLMLREMAPDAEISCICVDPERIGQQHHIPTVPVSAPPYSNPFLRLCNRISLRSLGRLENWLRAIRHVRRFDVIVVPGTSTLCDYGSGPFGTPYGLFRWAAAARLCGVKFCFVGTGAGPIQRPLSRWMLKSVASWAWYRSFRDQVSKDFITSLGIDTSSDQVYPDLVFKMPAPRQQPSVQAGSQAPTTIGVGLMNYNGWMAAHDSTIYDTYLARMAGFVTSLLARNFRVRLLIGETADRQAVEDLARVVAKSGYALKDGGVAAAASDRFVTAPTRSLHDLMRQIADTHVVVATRYHNVVCALKLARPTISIGYEAKNDAVMAQLGVGEFCQFIEDLDIGRLEQQLTRLLSDRAHYEQLIRRNLETLQLGLIRQQEALLSKVLCG